MLQTLTKYCVTAFALSFAVAACTQDGARQAPTANFAPEFGLFFTDEPLRGRSRVAAVWPGRADVYMSRSMAARGGRNGRTPFVEAGGIRVRGLISSMHGLSMESQTTAQPWAFLVGKYCEL